MSHLNSDHINALIESIAANPSKNDKVTLLAAHKDDPQLKRVLSAALNPLVSYGISQRTFPALPTSYGDGQFDDGTWFLVDIIAKRESTGHAARTAIEGELARLTAASAALLQRIILKDLRAGFDASTTNKAIKGLIPVFPYMRCSLPKDAKLDDFFEHGAIVQEKADGLYLNIDHEHNGFVRLTTRQGTEYPLDAFGEFVNRVRSTFSPGTQTHGEMVVLFDSGLKTETGHVIYERFERQDGNGILNSVANGGDFPEGVIPQFLAWDQIPLDVVKPKGKYEVPYDARLGHLATQLKLDDSPYLDLIETEVVKTMDEAWAFYRKKLKEGKEGAVVKKAKAIWKDGTSKEQIKLKLKCPVELRIKGFVEGNGKYVGTLGAFQMESECGQLKVNVNGRGDDQRNEVWANREKYLEGIAAVEANSIMEPGESSAFHSLFLPVLVEIRTDKSEADDLQRIRDQFKAAMEAA